MQHTDPDQLALLALGESLDDEQPQVTAHLRECEMCRHEVEALRRTVDLARETVEYRGDAPRPPEAVWSRISAELDLATPPGVDPGVGNPSDSSPFGRGFSGGAGDGLGGVRPGGSGDGRRTPGGHEPQGGRLFGHGSARTGADGSVGDAGSDAGMPAHAAGRRLQWLRPVAALAAAAAVGALATLTAVRPWQDDAPAPAVARSTASLSAVAGGPGAVSGRAVVVEGPSGPELDVSAAGLPLQKGYYEVWVFDGERSLVSVGVLGADSTASLSLPPTLDLRKYHVVDISHEQYDGEQTHSEVSVLRGTLTG